MFCIPIPKQIKRLPESSWPHIDRIFSGRRPAAMDQALMVRPPSMQMACRGTTPGTPPPPARRHATLGSVTAPAPVLPPVPACTYVVIIYYISYKIIYLLVILSQILLVHKCNAVTNQNWQRGIVFLL